MDQFLCALPHGRDQRRRVVCREPRVESHGAVSFGPGAEIARSSNPFRCIPIADGRRRDVATLVPERFHRLLSREPQQT